MSTNIFHKLKKILFAPLKQEIIVTTRKVTYFIGIFLLKKIHWSMYKKYYFKVMQGRLAWIQETKSHTVSRIRTIPSHGSTKEGSSAPTMDR